MIYELELQVHAFLFNLKTSLKCTNCEIFTPNKKTNSSCITNIHVLLDSYALCFGYDLNPASYLVIGPDYKLPLEYGHVGHDGFIDK